MAHLTVKRRHSEPTILDWFAKKDNDCRIEDFISTQNLTTVNGNKSITLTRPDFASEDNQIMRKVSCPLPICEHRFRKKITTEKTTLILIAIVVLFLLTHSYRLAIRFYEVVMPQSNTSDNFEYCYSLGR
jgi:hypothetical protein